MVHNIIFDLQDNFFLHCINIFEVPCTFVWNTWTFFKCHKEFFLFESYRHFSEIKLTKIMHKHFPLFTQNNRVLQTQTKGKKADWERMQYVLHRKFSFVVFFFRTVCPFFFSIVFLGSFPVLVQQSHVVEVAGPARASSGWSYNSQHVKYSRARHSLPKGLCTAF